MKAACLTMCRGYECIQRWNSHALDPNRHYTPGSPGATRSLHPRHVHDIVLGFVNVRVLSCIVLPVEECAAVVELVAALEKEAGEFLCHLDLHETTDTDDSEFRPAKASR